MDTENPYRHAWQPYVIAITIVAAAAALRFWPLHVLEGRLAWLTFYPAVMVATLFGGLTAGLLATFVSCLVVLFVLPEFLHRTFIADSVDWLGLAVFVVTCALIAGIGEATRRARAREKQVAAERDRFFALSLDMMCISKSDGYFKRLNPAFTETLGWSAEEILARPFLEFVHPDDRAATLQAVEEQVVAGKKILQFENRYQHKDGSWRVLSWKSVPQPGGLMYATARDITELRRTNQALEAVNNELEAFAYSVSHDLRQPLRAVDGFCDALYEDYQDKLDETGKRYLGQVRAGARRMAQLIDELLELSRITRADVTRQAVDMTTIAEKIASELRQGEPTRSVAVHIAEGLQANTDPRMVDVLLRNLLGNAWKFTGKREHPRIEFGVENDRPQPAFFVRDNGAGFDMKYAHKLFGAFQRLHSGSEFPGNGIGLATAQRIVLKLGGTIWADAKPNEGATFYFTL